MSPECLRAGRPRLLRNRNLLLRRLLHGRRRRFAPAAACDRSAISRRTLPARCGRRCGPLRPAEKLACEDQPYVPFTTVPKKKRTGLWPVRCGIAAFQLELKLYSELNLTGRARIAGWESGIRNVPGIGCCGWILNDHA